MSQVEYFKIPKGFSDQVDRLSWSEGCDAIVLEGGPTLALGSALAQFLEGAFRNTQPIHFAYVLHFLASTKYEDDQWRRLHDLGFAVNRNSGALFAALTRQVPRLDLDFNIPEARRLLLQQTELVPVHWLETGSPELAIDLASFESGVSRVLASMTSEDIVNWLRHGRGALPDTEPPPELPKREQSFTDLVEKLLKSPRLAGVSDLMQQVVAAVSIPPRSQRRTELPVGGYSSIVNRGQPDQILMSEHAVDELEFLRRYANNELLYWQREEPQNQQAEELCIVLDQGVRTWGEPRLALTAAALALGKQAEKAEMPCNFVFSGADFQSAHADIAEGKLAGSCTARPQMSAPLFESSDLTSNPAQALRQAFSEASTVKDIILLTHPRNLDEPEITHAASQQSENQRLFAITVDEQGNGTLQQLTTSGRIKLRTFELNIQAPKTEQPKPEVEPTKDRQWTGDIDPIPMPFNLGIREVVAAISLISRGRTLVTVNKIGAITLVDVDRNTSETLQPIVFENEYFQPTEIIEIPDGVFLLGDTTSTRKGTDTIGVQVDLRTQSIWALRLCAQEKPYHSLIYCPDSKMVISTILELPAIAIGLDGPKVANSFSGDFTRPIMGRGKAVQDLSLFKDVSNGLLTQDVAINPATGGIAAAVASGDPVVVVPTSDGFPVLKQLQNSGYLKLDGSSFRTPNLLAIEGQCEFDSSKTAIVVLAGHTLDYCFSELSFHRGSGPSIVGSAGRVAYWAGPAKIEVREVFPASKLVMRAKGRRTHSSIASELGQNWLTLHGGKFTHLLRWDRGPLEISFMQGQKNIGEFVQKRRDTSVLNPHGSTATPNKLTETYRQRWQKQCFKGNLTLLSDSTGNVAVLGDEDKLIVMFHVYRGTIAAWMPDGTHYGPASLTGGATTKGALDKIGAALSEASS